MSQACLWVPGVWEGHQGRGSHHSWTASSNSLEQGGAEDEDPQVPRRVSSQTTFSSSNSQGSQEPSCCRGWDGAQRVPWGGPGYPFGGPAGAWAWDQGAHLEFPSSPPPPGGHVTWRQVPSALWAKFCWWSFRQGRWRWEKPGCECACPAPGPQPVSSRQIVLELTGSTSPSLPGSGRENPGDPEFQVEVGRVLSFFFFWILKHSWSLSSLLLPSSQCHVKWGQSIL